MAEILEINKKTFLSVAEAAKSFLYSKDHLTRLAKAKKVAAVQVGRRWFLSVDSLKNYIELQQIENELRNKHLSARRQIEIILMEKVRGNDTSSVHVARSNLVGVTVSALLVLLVGFFSVQSLPDLTNSQAANIVDSEGRVANEQLVIQPVFSTDRTNVFVESDRSIIHPREQSSEFITVNP